MFLIFELQFSIYSRHVTNYQYIIQRSEFFQRYKVVTKSVEMTNTYFMKRHSIVKKNTLTNFKQLIPLKLIVL